MKKTTKDDVKEKAAEIIADRGNVRQLPDLLVSLEEPKTRKSGLHAVSKVLTHLLRRGDLRALGGDEKDAAVQYAQWLVKVFDEAWLKMVALLQEKDIGELTLSLVMRLLATMHEAAKDQEATTHWSGEEVQKFRLVLANLCSADKDCGHLIERFQEYTEYADVRVHVIQGLLKLIKKTTKQPSLVFRTNLMKLLEVVNFCKPNEEEVKSTFMCSPHYEYNHESAQKSFNALWEEFFKMKHKEQELYKRVLVILDDKVMPFLSRPLLLTDFLMESYAIGGSVSLLALSGVFTLISKHNLEYPAFYTKLYALCQPELLHAKYRARFFYMADLFLASSHLPQYLVAAFIKRLARLCLTGPANAIVMVLPFIGNLLMRHKGLLKMVDNTWDEEGNDPYDMNDKDPSTCRAVESGLWEIRTLQNHALPQVSQMAKFIDKKLPQMEWNLAQYLDVTMEEMVETEARKKIFVNVPLTFERPRGMTFPKEDISSKHFTLLV